MLIPILLSSLSFAADHELALEAGRLGAHEGAWNNFDTRDRLGSLGLRVGYAPIERVQVFGTWQHTRRGASQNFSYDASLSEAPGYDLGLSSAFTGHTAGLGVRADLAITPYFNPYVFGQGLAQLGTIRLDDDSETSENPNQLTQKAWAPGFAAGIGGEIKMAPPEWAIRPSMRLELGYGRTAQLDFAELGDMQFAGFYGRIAAGVTF